MTLSNHNPQKVHILKLWESGGLTASGVHEIRGGVDQAASRDREAVSKQQRDRLSSLNEPGGQEKPSEDRQMNTIVQPQRIGKLRE